jgi:hypothetical protein
MYRNKWLRGLCIAASVLFLIYAGLLATKSIRGFTTSMAPGTFWPWLGDKPVSEDGYYMLTVADNLATTGHLTYNYGLAATGIQPLATFVFAGLAWFVHLFGGDRFTISRVIILFGSVLSILFAWMLGRLAALFAPPERQALVFTFAYLITLFDFSSFRLFTYGLETGIYLCCLTLSLILWHRVVTSASEPSSTRWRDMILLGIAGGFSGLARIDFGLVFAFLLVWLLVRKLASITQVLVAGALALIIVSPWFIFVHSVTGGWMPSSGSAESALGWFGDNRFARWGVAMLGHLAPWSYAGADQKPLLYIGYLSLIILIILFFRAPQTRTLLRSSIAVRNTFLPWGIAFLTLTFLYAGFFLSTHFYTRYFSPMLLLIIPLIALILSEQRLFQRLPAVFALFLIATFGVFCHYTLHFGYVGNPHFPATDYLRTTFPGVRIGAFQSGAIGYFNPNVENLDGKLNLGALRAQRAHRLDDFIDAEHINVLIDWSSYLHDNFPQSYLDSEWQPCPHTPPNPQDTCLIRKTFLQTHPQYH